MVSSSKKSPEDGEMAAQVEPEVQVLEMRKRMVIILVEDGVE